MALTADRNTPERAGNSLRIGVAASTKCYAGGLACQNASGYAAPGSTATTLTALGRFEEQVDNSDGADGDLEVDIKPGIFRFANSSGGDEITIADRKADAYIVDDQTVAKTDGSGTRSKAGVIVDVDSLGVWVDVGA